MLFLKVLLIVKKLKTKKIEVLLMYFFKCIYEMILIKEFYHLFLARTDIFFICKIWIQSHSWSNFFFTNFKLHFLPWPRYTVLETVFLPLILWLF